MRARELHGSIVFNKLRGTWNFLWVEGAKRRSRKLGTLAELPTRAAAIAKSKTVMAGPPDGIPIIRELVEQFRLERMPERFSTRYGYEAWLRNHILPRWGGSLLTELQPRPVELWLRSLPLSAKSKVHIRGVLYQLWEFAAWSGMVSLNRNPMSLVKISGASKRCKKPRSLTVDEFQRFLKELEEPIRTVALVSVAFGLRISEALALRWSDVDWLNHRLKVEKGMVRQHLGKVKTPESEAGMSIASEMLQVLQTWRQTSQFSCDEDWVFASPVKIGRLPISYSWVWKAYQAGAMKAGLSGFGTHTLRHTYRSLMDAVGTPIAVQQKLMRHSDIRTTLNVYGDVITDEMTQTNAKVARMVLPRTN